MTLIIDRSTAKHDKETAARFESLSCQVGKVLAHVPRWAEVSDGAE